MEHKNTQLKNMSQPQESTMNRAEGFGGLGIEPQLMRSLDALRFKVPTPIQHKTIPIALAGKDVIGIAQTGTGKTLAFGIPIIQRLAAMPGKQGLIILPTRELALQVEETLQKVSRGFGLRTAVLIGGTGMGLQIKNLRNKPHIIIATPGRLQDHLTRKTVRLDSVAILVLDEADHMFDMGFAIPIKKILALLPPERQTLLFSATMPPEILKIATIYMQSPLRFEIAPQGTAAEKVEHELFFVQREQRMPLLKKILAENSGSALIFLRTKYAAKKTCQQLTAVNILAAEIHSNRSLSQRTEALFGFKKGKYRVLVATDIASRGIDVKEIAMVINYDLPESASDYVHRIGRTGRAGLTGKAISFAMPDQRNKIRAIERLIRYAIPISKTPGLPPISIIPIPQESRRNYTYNNNFQRKKKFNRNFSKPSL